MQGKENKSLEHKIVYALFFAVGILWICTGAVYFLWLSATLSELSMIFIVEPEFSPIIFNFLIALYAIQFLLSAAVLVLGLIGGIRKKQSVYIYAIIVGVLSAGGVMYLFSIAENWLA